MSSRVDMPTAVSDSAWFKSSYSSGEGGECVEVAVAARVHIRDSKQTSGPVLTVGPGAWAGFVGLVTS
ncbi:DUF397 domain-containing protein [Streptomyces poriferorum]|uniref:DUF397 domain-containing protein n=1 Tax=Streptomyces poriferorum TaxID=2798799 RepID=A0ABY9IL71_9ACTN|nr:MULTISPECIES: DUF397 domain-containing protein [unclassified Streptomyces]MDP5316638.1 DUF397 domain-containing protein [Streptomyces sp. Alt4]WLQ54943.1 DUF397 domain-containing protein [Streptomyces sp. Alt2]